MILWALGDLQQGWKIQFMAPTREQAAEIIYQARNYAWKLGFPHRRILIPLPYGVESNPKFWPKGAKVYRDHTLNHSGGVVHEPQVGFNHGPGHEYCINCPWCRQEIREVFARDEAVSEGMQQSTECASCGQRVMVHVERVEVHFRAWREHEER